LVVYYRNILEFVNNEAKCAQLKQSVFITNFLLYYRKFNIRLPCNKSWWVNFICSGKQ